MAKLIIKTGDDELEKEEQQEVEQPSIFDKKRREATNASFS